MKRPDLIITHHALYRYIERVLGWDWSEIRDSVREQVGRTRISEREIIEAAEEHLDLTPIREQMLFAIAACGKTSRPVLFGIWPTVIENGKVVTVLEPISMFRHRRERAKRARSAA